MIRLIRTLALVGLVLVVASACSKNPIQPSANNLGNIPQAPLTVTLSNLTERYAGTSDQICGDVSAKVPIDNLTLDYQVTGGSLAGAVLLACDSDACGTSTPIATVVQCPAPPDPCAAGIVDSIAQGAAPACLTGDPTGSGSVQVMALHPSASSTWNIEAFFGNTGYASNTVSAPVDQGSVASNSGSMSSTQTLRRLRRMHR
jgi:hypothetical protein